MGQDVLEGRHALVTGGARGLGAGMAQALAAAGAAVMLGDVLDDLAAETAEQIAATGATASSVHLDVTDEGDWEAAIATTIKQLGGLDILVNNAGIEISALIVDAEAADLRRMLEVNVLGTALGIKHGLRAMRPDGPAGRGGAIVNIASVAATIAFPGIAGYSATKSAVDRLTRVAAFEAGKLGLRRAGQLRLPRPRADGDGHAARRRHGRARPLREPRRGGRRRRRADPARAPRRGGRHGRRGGLPRVGSGALHHGHRPARRRRNGDVSASDTPVVAYGAPGSTGRLIREYLRASDD